MSIFRGISVDLIDAPHPHELEIRWRQLEAQAEGSFFTSWSWIGCWLHGLGTHVKPMLVQAFRDDQVVGLGIFVKHRTRRFKVFSVRNWYLHATGDVDEDSITIEHNGFLIHHVDTDTIAGAMYAHILNHTAEREQVVLPGLSPHQKPSGPLPSDLVLRERARNSFVVDLDAVRRRAGDYVGILSSNSRTQVRRSLKEYEKLGPLQLTEATHIDTALEFLAELKVLHERRWAKLGRDGAFSTSAFESFHLRLLDTAFRYGFIQLLRVQAGPKVVGYLYNFVYRGRVLFYQSGFDYELIPNHSRPGMVAHVLTVQHNAKLGHRVYDLLAGDTQYKRSLSTDVEIMSWVTVHRVTLGFQIETFLRMIKRNFFTVKPPAPGPGLAASTVTESSLTKGSPSSERNTAWN